MIVVSRYDGGIKINGHAHYAEPGKDIVCAGVSALVQNLISSIEELTQDQFHYVAISPGKVDINFRNLSEHAQLLVDSFFVGVQLIADNYPYNVTVQALNT